MKMEPKDYEMLARVNFSHPDFVEWLRSRLERTDVDVRKNRDDVEVRWAQGRGQELEYLIKELESANINLGKANSAASAQRKSLS